MKIHLNQTKKQQIALEVSEDWECKHVSVAMWFSLTQAWHI